MANATFLAILHFLGYPAFGDAFMAEIARIGVLRFGQFSKDPLLFTGCLFYTIIEFILGRMAGLDFSVFYLLTRFR